MQERTLRPAPSAITMLNIHSNDASHKIICLTGNTIPHGTGLSSVVITIFLHVTEMRFEDEHRGNEVHFSFP